MQKLTLTQQKRRLEQTTIWFGYGLFVVVIVAVSVDTIIPWLHLLLSPSMGVRYLNDVTALVTFVATAILPALLSYLLGDRATRRNDRVMHHFNGVAFAVATYWLSLLCSFIGAPLTSALYQVLPYPYAMLTSVWPVAVIVGSMAVVAAMYSTSATARKRSVIYHTPYQVVLLGGMLATFMAIFMSIGVGQVETWLATIVYGCLVALAVVIAYWRLRQLRGAILPRVTQAVIAVSLGLAMATFVAQITPFSNTTALLPTTIGLIIWIVYLAITTRRG
ncbi:MAG: hypothetical protein WAS27_02020 [Candidatus Saccharimonadales bacterium]